MKDEECSPLEGGEGGCSDGQKFILQSKTLADKTGLSSFHPSSFILHFYQVIAIVGPTASGKTSLAIHLAQRFDAEIISADSMQFYRGMAIGSAAPTPDEQACARHHFVGFLDPSEDFSAGAFELIARDVVRDINARGVPAIVVGGAGLYIRALVDGLFEGPGKDAALRMRLHAEARERGVGVLYERLQGLDPEYAAGIGVNDLRRIVRALEVHEIAGRPLSVLHREHRAIREPLDALWVALDYPRDELYARIDARLDAMIAHGFVQEVQDLLDRGYLPHIERLRCLGYRELAGHLLGETTLDEAVALIKRNTRRYAKRQLSWFRHEPQVQWLPATSATPVEQYADAVVEILRQRSLE